MESIDIAVAPGSAAQDRAAVFRMRGRCILVVADDTSTAGAGGLGGAEAAEVVIVVVGRAATESRLGMWPAVLSELDRAFADRGHTTAVVAEVCGETLVGAAVGDSAAWLIADSSIEALTASVPRKPLIGSGRATPRWFRARLTRGTTLLLATDGLHKYASRSSILNCVNRSASAASLIDTARLPSRGLKDDVAIILARPQRRAHGEY